MAVVAVWQNHQKGEVVAFFDPKDQSVTTPPSSLPARSWKMDDATKKWLFAGHSPEEQASMLKQVADAEAKEKSSYFVSVPTAGMRSSTAPSCNEELFFSPMPYESRIYMLVKFEIYSDGRFWCGRGMGVDIFTQGRTLDELMENIREAVELHFEEELIRGESIRILTISECEVEPLVRASSC